MKKLPTIIDPCPITEAIFEVRFNSSLPDDAIFGIIYNQFKDEFKNVEQLPILQLPVAIRNQDPNLKFTPHYKISKDNFIVQIGPKVFSLACLKDYCGWSKFSEKIYVVFEKLQRIEVIDNLIRIALRYINVFENINILENSTLKLFLKGNQLGENHINLTAQMPFGNGASTLRLINLIETLVQNEPVKGSIIDIDTTVNFGNFESIKEAIENAHTAEKELFFSLLEENFLASLNPKYEG